MLKIILAGFLASAMLSGGALALCATSIPNNLANGTTADAAKVMANFNWITDCFGGTTLSAGPDLRLSQAGVGLQQTAANQYAYLTLIPGGSNMQSGLRLYNGSDGNNVGAVIFNVSGATANLQSSVWGSGTQISTLSTSFTNLLFAAASVQFSGIGTTASGANAFLDGSNHLLKSTSSIRYKREVRPLSYEDARKVLELTPVSFRSIAPADDPRWVFDGLTAEEVTAHLPQFVNYVKGPDGEEIPDGVQYDRIAAVALLRVVKEQQREIDALRSCRLWCMVEEAIGLRAAP
ncbi:MAG TPA: tail fiber domain-containing protein [Stellaceae bacterium]|jgi:hypothetical protein|nr:tail fiber domain-containing protein [Stellaceae bacterium]